jgi:hypothetical protein
MYYFNEVILMQKMEITKQIKILFLNLKLEKCQILNIGKNKIDYSKNM